MSYRVYFVMELNIQLKNQNQKRVLVLKKAANRRKDNISEKFENLYNIPESASQGITKNEEAMQAWLLLYPFRNSVHLALSSYLGI